MAIELYIPPCINTPAHTHHPPPPDKPLRIQIDGLLTSIQKLLPDVAWPLDARRLHFPLPAGSELAKVAFRKIYGREVDPELHGDLVVRDEYLRWVVEVRLKNEIDYYGVTFDHLVPADDPDPEVLQISIIETDNDDGAFANKYLKFKVDSKEYLGSKLLAVPRCCQLRKGTTDRGRVNDNVLRKEKELERIFSTEDFSDKLGTGGNATGLGCSEDFHVP